MTTRNDAPVDHDALVCAAHNELSAALTETQKPYDQYATRAADAYEALAKAYRVANNAVRPLPNSAMCWAFVDAEVQLQLRADDLREELGRRRKERSSQT